MLWGTLVDQASSAATSLHFCESSLSKRLPFLPNSVAAMETRALFIERKSLIISSPESVTLDHLSGHTFLQNLSFSTSRKRTSLFLAAFDLILEEAFERKWRKHQSQYSSRVTSMLNRLADGQVWLIDQMGGWWEFFRGVVLALSWPQSMLRSCALLGAVFLISVWWHPWFPCSLLFLKYGCSKRYGLRISPCVWPQAHVTMSSLGQSSSLSFHLRVIPKDCFFID